MKVILSKSNEIAVSKTIGENYCEIGIVEYVYIQIIHTQNFNKVKY